MFNKIDQFVYSPKEEDDLSPRTTQNYSLEELKKTWMSKVNRNMCVFISAHEKMNIDEFKAMLYEEVKRIFQERYPYNNFLY